MCVSNAYQCEQYHARLTHTPSALCDGVSFAWKLSSIRAQRSLRLNRSGWHKNIPLMQSHNPINALHNRSHSLKQQKRVVGTALSLTRKSCDISGEYFLVQGQKGARNFRNLDADQRFRGIGALRHKSQTREVCVCVCVRVCASMGFIIWQCHMCTFVHMRGVYVRIHECKNAGTCIKYSRVCG